MKAKVSKPAAKAVVKKAKPAAKKTVAKKAVAKKAAVKKVVAKKVAVKKVAVKKVAAKKPVAKKTVAKKVVAKKVAVKKVAVKKVAAKKPVAKKAVAKKPAAKKVVAKKVAAKKPAAKKKTVAKKAVAKKPAAKKPAAKKNSTEKKTAKSGDPIGVTAFTQQWTDAMKHLGQHHQMHDPMLHQHYDTVFDVLHDQLDHWVRSCDNSLKMGDKMREQLQDTVHSAMDNSTRWSQSLWQCHTLEDVMDWQQKMFNQMSNKAFNDLTRLAEAAAHHGTASMQPLFKHR